MTELFLLSDAQMARISPFFRLSHGIPRSDDRRVIRGIIFVIRNGLQWRDVPPSYGPHKTIYARYDRCARNFMSAIAIAAIVIFWI
jgi:putative transposase